MKTRQDEGSTPSTSTKGIAMGQAKRRQKKKEKKKKERDIKMKKRRAAIKAEHREEKVIEKIRWQNRSRITPFRKSVEEE